MFRYGIRPQVMNPEKMRGEYGKLIYMLQDSVTPEVAQVKTVFGNRFDVCDTFGIEFDVCVRSRAAPYILKAYGLNRVDPDSNRMD